MHAAVYDAFLNALKGAGGVLLDAPQTQKLQAAMFPGGKLSPAFIAQDAPTLALRAGLAGPAFAKARFLMVAETGVGSGHPFSGEKLAPVLAVYRVADFDAATVLVKRILGYQGAGHSVGLYTGKPERGIALGHALPVCRVIVNQAHCFATGGSFDNALPFSLSMGCGTWGGNSISDNLSYRHFLNITRVVSVLPAVRVREPTEHELFGAYRRKFGA